MVIKIIKILFINLLSLLLIFSLVYGVGEINIEGPNKIKLSEKENNNTFLIINTITSEKYNEKNFTLSPCYSKKNYTCLINNTYLLLFNEIPTEDFLSKTKDDFESKNTDPKKFLKLLINKSNGYLDLIENYNIDNKEFITYLYYDILLREPDNEGLEFWLEQIEKGRTKKNIIYLFFTSDEFKNNIMSYNNNIYFFNFNEDLDCGDFPCLDKNCSEPKYYKSSKINFSEKNWHYVNKTPNQLGACEFTCGDGYEYIEGVCKKNGEIGCGSLPCEFGPCLYEGLILGPEPNKTTDKKWTYVDKEPSQLGVCEFTCKKGYEYKYGSCIKKVEPQKKGCGNFHCYVSPCVDPKKEEGVALGYEPNYVTNKSWHYVNKTPSQLGVCEFTCKEGYEYNNFGQCIKKSTRDKCYVPKQDEVDKYLPVEKDNWICFDKNANDINGQYVLKGSTFYCINYKGNSAKELLQNEEYLNNNILYEIPVKCNGNNKYNILSDMWCSVPKKIDMYNCNSKERNKVEHSKYFIVYEGGKVECENREVWLVLEGIYSKNPVGFKDINSKCLLPEINGVHFDKILNRNNYHISDGKVDPGVKISYISNNYRDVFLYDYYTGVCEDFKGWTDIKYEPKCKIFSDSELSSMLNANIKCNKHGLFNVNDKVTCNINGQDFTFKCNKNKGWVEI